MSNIIATIANVPVPDLEAAIPLYRQLAGVESVHRFEYKDLRLASCGPFLLIEGPIENYPPQVATILVRSVSEVRTAVEAAGGRLLEGPDEVPNGTRMLFTHPDGLVFEYLQPRG